MKKPIFRSIITVAGALLAMTFNASATVVMTINPATETFSYSGISSQSVQFLSDSFVGTTYFLANQATSNPNPSPNSSSTNEGILTSTITPLGLAYTLDNVGQVSVTHDIGLISVFLGTDLNFAAPRNIELTAIPTGSGTQSYSSFSAANKAYFESLDGEELFFVDRVTSSLVGTVGGGPALTVNVLPIPEPSTSLLTGLGCLLLLTKRRRVSV